MEVLAKIEDPAKEVAIVRAPFDYQLDNIETILSLITKENGWGGNEIFVAGELKKVLDEVNKRNQDCYKQAFLRFCRFFGQLVQLKKVYHRFYGSENAFDPRCYYLIDGGSGQALVMLQDLCRDLGREGIGVMFNYEEHWTGVYLIFDYFENRRIASMTNEKGEVSVSEKDSE